MASVEVRVGPTEAIALARSFDRATPQLERCVASGRARIPMLTGAVAFVVHRNGGSLAMPRVVLDHSDLGDRHTEQCLRGALREVARDVAPRFTPDAWVRVRVSVASSTAPTLCRGSGDPSSGICSALSPRLQALLTSLERTRARADEVLLHGCAFTNVTVWLDAEGRVVAFGVSSSNTDGDSPYAYELEPERAAATRTALSWTRAPRGAVAVAKATLSAGGCD